MISEQKLRKKGWTEAEIQKTMKILHQAEKNKSKSKKFFESFVYFFSILIAILGNLVVTILVVPLITIEGFVFYVMIALIALGFGALFTLLLIDLEKLNPRQHVIAGLFIPAIAFISIFFMVRFAQLFATDLGLEHVLVRSPIVIGIVYFIFYILPYVFVRRNEIFKISR
ncbi:hypothetical protein ACFL1H_07630 [Nanoarchaeota archaeon]